MMAAAICWIILILIFFLKYWGTIAYTNLKYSFKPAAKKQLTFGTKVYLSGFISFFNEPLFKILVSNFFGLNVVAYLEIGLKIRGQLSGLFSKVLQPLYPYLSSLKDKQHIAFLVKDLTSKIFLLVLPVCALLIITCKDIVTLWLQIDIYNYSLFIIGLVVPYLIFIPLTQPIYTYFLANGYPEKTIIFQTISVVTNIVCFFIFSFFIGMYAVIVSNVLSYLVGFLLGIYYQNRLLNIKYKFDFKYFKRISYIILMFIIIGLITDIFDFEIIRILFASIIVIPSVLWLYKRLEFIKLEDIDRYFGSNRFLVYLLNKI